jgi:LAO/AO transport system kinase
MASRGATGAISRSIRNSIRVLEYAGFDPIIIESVGAGQTEIEISNIADITVVVFNPHTGDSIQTIKAGITEIGDIYLVHKSDLEGASQLFQSVQDFIGTAEKNPLILKVSSKTGKGVTEFVTELKKIMQKRKKEKKLSEKQRLSIELDDIILNTINQKVATMLHSNKTYSGYLKKVQDRKIDPFEAAEKISNSIMK